MSGHSKWSTIKRKKGALDAKRSKIFTKIIKEISVAVRESGPDPESNPRLRLAIQSAKAANMPKENMERAIKKGSGADEANYSEVTYEGYASHGVAVCVECLTDNINRTVASVRSAFNKHGGALGTTGSLDFLFDRKGVFVLKQNEKPLDEEEFTFDLIDAGADEVFFEDGFITIYCAMEDFGALQKKVESLALEVESAELQRIPKTTIALDDEALKKVLKLVDVLEDDDDVQKVYHNLELNQEQMAALEE
ncbi:YebC/PmpR family DNA-binding transcriptional regulator [Adhaeribacter radiodurans]|uniref:Probable transcriptional regulatory protein HUW48_20905 n=1 Tax=Adhaeribacter radiodurans TaxID=2745197 RepID=A0A7L7LBW7_9BACT|nr:YebC/PmpR family DNA-binding transcriptional regulator [Adhaeribacter radiodurans]QMU30338.1 YebC/PmpR family DNA-binding transcriptional regulator [Adhaeribacter radiodurans]